MCIRRVILVIQAIVQISIGVGVAASAGDVRGAHLLCHVPIPFWKYTRRLLRRFKKINPQRIIDTPAVNFFSLLASGMSLFKRLRFSASGNPCRKRKNSGKELLLFLFLAFLADCCILFTITSKKTKCSTALSAPIFSPLLFCLSGVFPLGRSKKPHLHYTRGKKDFRFNRCPGVRIVRL